MSQQNPADRNTVITRFMGHLELAKKDLDEIMHHSRVWSSASPIHKDLKVLQRDMAMMSAHALKVLKDACELDARQRILAHHSDDRRPDLLHGQMRGAAPPAPTGRNVWSAPESEAEPEPEPEQGPEQSTEPETSPAPEHVSGTHTRAASPFHEAPTPAERQSLSKISKTAQGLPPELLRQLQREVEEGGGD